MKRNTFMASGLAAGGAIVVGLTMVAGNRMLGAPSTVSTSRPGVLSAAAGARSLNVAERLAAVNGDQHPSRIALVETTRAAALKAATPGDEVPQSPDTNVYVFLMEGRFRGFGLPVLAGQSIPHGEYMTVVVNAKTFAVMDVGLSGRPPTPPISSLGRVITLEQSAVARTRT
jgi:hypothetical protein